MSKMLTTSVRDEKEKQSTSNITKLAIKVLVVADGRHGSCSFDRISTPRVT